MKQGARNIIIFVKNKSRSKSRSRGNKRNMILAKMSHHFIKFKRIKRIEIILIIIFMEIIRNSMGLSNKIKKIFISNKKSINLSKKKNQNTFIKKMRKQTKKNLMLLKLILMEIII